MESQLRSIHVVAGVISDVRGRILLTRRGEDSDLAGLWEFPGGKREPGESSQAALARELDEELGIEVEVGERLVEVPQQYPSKRLRLEVFRIARWKGTPRGREGQANRLPGLGQREAEHPGGHDAPAVGATQERQGLAGRQGQQHREGQQEAQQREAEGRDIVERRLGEREGAAPDDIDPGEGEQRRGRRGGPGSVRQWTAPVRSARR